MKNGSKFIGQHIEGFRALLMVAYQPELWIKAGFDQADLRLIVLGPKTGIEVVEDLRVRVGSLDKKRSWPIHIKSREVLLQQCGLHS